MSYPIHEVTVLQKKKDNLSTVRISENLAAEVDRILQTEVGKALGFRSRADFVTTAIRDFLREDLTPVYLPGDLVRLINDLIKTRKRWVSTEEFVIEAVKERLKEYEVYR